MSVIAERVTLPDDADIDAFLSFEIDGKPAASDPDVARRKVSAEYFYSDDQAEKNVLFSGLFLAREFPKAASKRESPDFEITLHSDQHVFVEITQAAADAQRENPIGDLNGGINEWVASSPAVRDRLDNWHAIVNIPIAPGGRVRQAFDDLKRFLGNAILADFDLDAGCGNRAIGEPYTVLSELFATASTKRVAAGRMVLVKVAPGTAADPWDGADLVNARIDAKRALARDWRVRPLWLIVDIGSVTHPKMTMDIVADTPPEIEPFDRVIICAGRLGRRGLILTSGPTD
jgi:hypothetical protein